MILRRATQADVATLTDVIASAYAPFLRLGLPAVTEGIDDDIRDNLVWVAEVDGRVVGGIVIVLSKDAHIANLAVHPDAGGHGVGRALIARAIAAASEAGFAVIHLATHKDMVSTQRFYEALGWERAGHEDNKVYFKRQLK